MKITTKGQVTIPIEIREKVGMLPDTEVEFGLRGDTVTLRKAIRNGGRDRGKKVVARLRGSGHGRMTTAEILGLMRGEE